MLEKPLGKVREVLKDAFRSWQKRLVGRRPVIVAEGNDPSLMMVEGLKGKQEESLGQPGRDGEGSVGLLVAYTHALEEIAWHVGCGSLSGLALPACVKKKTKQTPQNS